MASYMKLHSESQAKLRETTRDLASAIYLRDSYQAFIRENGYSGAYMIWLARRMNLDLFEATPATDFIPMGA